MSSGKGATAGKTERARARRGWLVGAGVAVAAAAAGVAWARSAGGGGAAEDAGYPPLDTPKPFAESLWIVDSAPVAPMGLTLPVRMTVVRLENGDLLLHSPTRYTPALAEALAAIGPVRHLVAPSFGHWTFLKAWQQAYPDATSWAVPGLRDRSQVRRAGVRIDRELEDVAPPAWAADMVQVLVGGAAGFREVCLFHKASRTLLLVDLMQNLEPAKLPPLTRAAMTAAAATRGTTARYLRVLIRWNAREAADKIRGLIALDPQRVIVAHGAVVTERGAEHLRRGFGWLLGTGPAAGDRAVT